jgi:hypothetical protein
MEVTPMILYYETTLITISKAQDEGKSGPFVRTYEPVGDLELTRLPAGTRGVVRLSEGHPLIPLIRAAWEMDHAVVSRPDSKERQFLRITNIGNQDGEVAIYVEVLP